MVDMFPPFIKQSASLPRKAVPQIVGIPSLGSPVTEGSKYRIHLGEKKKKVVPQCQGFLPGLFLPLFCED